MKWYKSMAPGPRYVVEVRHDSCITFAVALAQLKNVLFCAMCGVPRSGAEYELEDVAAGQCWSCAGTGYAGADAELAAPCPEGCAPPPPEEPT